ncbi:MAG TPA: alpha/beta fold hydrolase [Dehalococcoidia bacterium]|nr:alpha/beta fold hydrolase [Dehalococcoidia bacterium]
MPFLSIDGRRLHYCTAGGAGTAPLLLLHGLGDDARGWSPQMEPLAARFRLVAPDLPGQGESEAPPQFADYAVEAQAEVVAALLEHLEIERAHVAGHALGGIVALAFALAYPERLAGLILESTSPEPLPDALRERMRRALTRDQERGPGGGETMAASARSLRSRSGETEEAPPTPAAWALVAFDGFVPRLETLTAPTLVVVGESDSAFLQRGAELLHVWIPFSRLVRVPNAARVPHQENPAAFAAEVAGFLREVETMT